MTPRIVSVAAAALVVAAFAAGPAAAAIPAAPAAKVHQATPAAKDPNVIQVRHLWRGSRRCRRLYRRGWRWGNWRARRRYIRHCRSRRRVSWRQCRRWWYLGYRRHVRWARIRYRRFCRRRWR